jgi:hypothetical protein
MCFGSAFEKNLNLNFIFFFAEINIFLMFSDHFDVLMSKIIFKKYKKNIILICFRIKIL